MDDCNYLKPSKSDAINIVDGLPTTSMQVVEAVVPDHEKDVVQDHEKGEETPLDGIYTIQFQDTPYQDVQQQNALEELMKSVAGLHAKFNKLIDMMTDAANITASGKEDTSDKSNADFRIDEFNLIPINTGDKMDAVELKY
ncbi:hypothetical protein FQA39_LY10441 [Lamprigera yunnana]|nr:hypothetical protein FQA39_LY10441 [Lamprigera yunnana]